MVVDEKTADILRSHLRGQAMRYRVFDINATPLGSGRILVYSKRSGITKVFSLPDAKKLLACQAFDTLQHHALAFAQQTEGGSLKSRVESKRVRGRLKDWMAPFRASSAAESKRIANVSQSIQLELAALAEEGFLISEEDLLADIVCRLTTRTAEPFLLGK